MNDPPSPNRPKFTHPAPCEISHQPVSALDFYTPLPTLLQEKEKGRLRLRRSGGRNRQQGHPHPDPLPSRLRFQLRRGKPGRGNDASWDCFTGLTMTTRSTSPNPSLQRRGMSSGDCFAALAMTPWSPHPSLQKKCEDYCGKICAYPL